MEVEMSLLFSIASLIGLIVGFLIEHFKVISDIKERLSVVETRTNSKTLEKIDERLDCITERLGRLETKTDLFWKAIETKVIEMLHHPNSPERDTLLEKFKDGSISINELEELKTILECNPPKRKPEALAAVLLVARIDQILYDAGKLHQF